MLTGVDGAADLAIGHDGLVASVASALVGGCTRGAGASAAILDIAIGRRTITSSITTIRLEVRPTGSTSSRRRTSNTSHNITNRRTQISPKLIARRTRIADPRGRTLRTVRNRTPDISEADPIGRIPAHCTEITVVVGCTVEAVVDACAV